MERDRSDTPEIVHLFRGPTPQPQPGDRALCGWVLPWEFRPMAPGSFRCEECVLLELER